MNDFLPARGSSRPSLREWWKAALTVLVCGVVVFAGFNLPGVAMAFIGRLGPQSPSPAVVAAPLNVRTGSVGSRDVTTVRLPDGRRMVLDPGVPLPPEGTPVVLTRSGWTGYPLRLDSALATVELLPARFGPLWAAVTALVLAPIMIVLVWRRHGARRGLLLVVLAAFPLFVGFQGVDQDLTTLAHGSPRFVVLTPAPVAAVSDVPPRGPDRS